MRDYSQISPEFWIGETGISLRGHPEAQIVALYLLTCPLSNMIGLYHIAIPVIAHETGLSIKGASKGLQRGEEVGFLNYDRTSETVFIPKMSKFQLGEELKPGDNRVKAVQKMALQMRKSRFYKDFVELYDTVYGLHLSSFEGACEQGANKGLSKPLRSQEQEQEQEQEIEQEQKQESPYSPPRDVGGKKKKTVKTEYCQKFEVFWNTYPRKSGKRKAYMAWAAAGKRIKAARGLGSTEAAEFLLERATAFAATPKGRHPQYCPFPATWLNQDRFDDDPVCWQTAGDEKTQPTTGPVERSDNYSN
jgi:hypothetical protein